MQGKYVLVEMLLHATAEDRIWHVYYLATVLSTICLECIRDSAISTVCLSIGTCPDSGLEQEECL